MPKNGIPGAALSCCAQSIGILVRHGVWSLAHIFKCCDRLIKRQRRLQQSESLPEWCRLSVTNPKLRQYLRRRRTRLRSLRCWKLQAMDAHRCTTISKVHHRLRTRFHFGLPQSRGLRISLEEHSPQGDLADNPSGTRG
jgi:hypothetical protein